MRWERGGGEMERDREFPLAELGLQWVTKRSASRSRVLGWRVTCGAAQTVSSTWSLVVR